MMLRVLQSKKGSTYLDVFATLFILLMMASMLVTTTHFFSQNQQDVRQLTNFNQTCNNVVMETYLIDDWTGLTEKVVETSTGDITITYDYQGISSAYLTHQLTVQLTQGSHTKAYQMEKSVAHVE